MLTQPAGGVARNLDSHDENPDRARRALNTLDFRHVGNDTGDYHLDHHRRNHDVE